MQTVPRSDLREILRLAIAAALIAFRDPPPADVRGGRTAHFGVRTLANGRGRGMEIVETILLALAAARAISASRADDRRSANVTNNGRTDG
jgi:hypothetical protein